MPKQQTVRGCLNPKEDIGQCLCLTSSFYLIVKACKQSAVMSEVRSQHEHAVAVVRWVKDNEPKVESHERHKDTPLVEGNADV